MSDVAAQDPPKTRKKRGGIYVTDTELIEHMGVPEKLARQTLKVLDASPTACFPKKNPLWGTKKVQ